MPNHAENGALSANPPGNHKPERGDPPSADRRNRTRWKKKLWLTVSGVVVALLAASVFTLGSLDTPLRPANGNDTAIFFALSVTLFAAFLVFSLILMRTLVRLGAERRSGQLGSRFKVKMVSGRDGHFPPAGGVPIFIFVCPGEPDIERVVPATAGNRERTKPKPARGFRENGTEEAGCRGGGRSGASFARESLPRVNRVHRSQLDGGKKFAGARRRGIFRKCAESSGGGRRRGAGIRAANGAPDRERRGSVAGG